MSEWARPDDSTDDPRPEPSIEVPLAGDAPNGDTADALTATSRRTVVVASIGCAIVIGVAVAAFALNDDAAETDDAAVATTIGVDASPAPSPPTLPPPATTIGSVRSLDPKINQPLYPSVGRSPSDVLARFDLGDSLAALARDRPTRATIRALVSADGATDESVITITHDPEHRRDLVTISRADAPTGVFIVDRDTGWIYSEQPDADGEESWLRYRPDQVLFDPTTGLEPFDAVRLGPVRTDNIDEALDIASGELVVIDEVGPPLRRFDVSMPITSVVNSSMFMFGLTLTDPLDPAVADEAAAFRVYVSEEPGVRLVTGRVDLDGRAIVIEHRLDDPDDRAPIELPDPASVIGLEPGLSDSDDRATESRLVGR